MRYGHGALSEAEMVPPWGGENCESITEATVSSTVRSIGLDERAKKLKLRKLLKNMVGPVGLEPTTFGL